MPGYDPQALIHAGKHGLLYLVLYERLFTSVPVDVQKLHLKA